MTSQLVDGKAQPYRTERQPQGKRLGMKLSVFGLGYVGCVSAACFAKKVMVVGVDVNPTKVEIINRGESQSSKPAWAN